MTPFRIRRWLALAALALGAAAALTRTPGAAARPDRHRAPEETGCGPSAS